MKKPIDPKLPSFPGNVPSADAEPPQKPKKAANARKALAKQAERLEKAARATEAQRDSFVPPARLENLAEILGQRAGLDVDSLPRGRALSTADMKAELNNIIEMIEHQYGPLPKKNETTGLDWNAAKAEALGAMDEVGSTRDGYFVVYNLLSKLNDAHVSVELPSSLHLSLPLQMTVREGKLTVTFIADDYPKGTPRPEPGDVLVSINGETPEDFQARYPYFRSSGNDDTSFELFALGLSSVRENRGIPLHDYPRDLKLTLERADGAKYVTEVSYHEEGQPLEGVEVDSNPSLIPPGVALRPPVAGIDSGAPAAPDLPGSTVAAAAQKYVSTLASSLPTDVTLSSQEMAVLLDVGFRFHEFHRLFGAYVRGPSIDIEGAGKGQPVRLGALEPMYQLPADFQRITAPQGLEQLFNAGSFFAGTFERNGKTIGLLRIPNYVAQNPGTLPLGINYFIGKLNQVADHLVIDQTGNTGGMVVFSDLLLQSLVGDLDPQKHMRFALKPSERFSRSFKDLQDALNDESAKDLFSPAERASLVAEVEATIAEIKQARDERRPLTKPISLLPQTKFFAAVIAKSLEPLKQRLGKRLEQAVGFDVFARQTFAVAKPADFLIDHLCFSGGDATPAGFKNHGRGRLPGTRTAGAGGTVEEFSYRSILELIIRLTTSLMVEPDDDLVENRGAQPDVRFEATIQDVRDGYSNYLERLLQTLGL